MLRNYSLLYVQKVEDVCHLFVFKVVSSLRVINSRSEWICLKRCATLPRYVYQAQDLYETTKLAYCIKPQTQWALSPPQSPICVTGRLEERGEKCAQSKVFVKKRPDPKLEADYEVPKTMFGIRGLRPGWDSGYQSKIGVTFGWSMLCNGCGIGRKSPSG